MSVPQGDSSPDTLNGTVANTEDDVFVFPLSFAQQRLWFLEQLEPGGALYNVPAALRLRGALDHLALRRSLNALVERHEALRTTFEVREQQPVQVVVPTLTLEVPLLDLGHLDEAARETRVQQLAAEEAARPFDLILGPLVRATILRLGEEDHVLLLTMHHIIADGWSAGILIREMITLYTAFSSNTPPLLADLPVQYADFAIWQREWLHGEALEEQLAYWRQKLADAPPLLELPTDRLRPAVQTLRGAVETADLPIPLIHELHALSREEGATLFMTLLATFQVLLARYSGQWDVLVGTPVANRNRSELEGLIGCFVNTLVLRSDLGGNPSFRTLLRQVRETCLEAYAHQDLPFEKLVEVLQPERDLSRSPLFQVLFILQNAPLPELALPGLTVAHMDVPTGLAKFDLTLALMDTPQGMKAALEYNTDLFDSTTAARMLQHFQTLLAAAVEHPDQRICDLPMLSPHERRLVLESWASGPSEHWPDAYLPDLFEAQAARTPEAVALHCGTSQLTYATLDRRANQLAHHLRRLGVGPEARVGLFLERTPHLLIALLAVLKAGGAYVPLDAGYPAERLAYMLGDADATVLLTEEALVERVPAGTACPVVVLEREGATLARERAEPPPRELRSDQLAYVLYTSGSTGQPKGVQVTHGALANFLHAMRPTFDLTHNDVFAAVTTLAFDIAALELYLPLTVGARVVIVSRDEAADGERLRAVLSASQATAMQATPTTWHLLLQSGWLPDRRFKVLCGGEALAPELAQRLVATCSSVWNLYGPTETTIWSSVQQLDASASVCLGHPITNTQIYLLDAGMRPVPLGAIGEIYIGGAGLARGYLHRPDLTADRFLPNPFSAAGGERLYRTGDLARYQADGTLRFLGRADHQVKLRGYRIELGEIEAALRAYPSIREAVALVRDDALGSQRLVAYVVGERAQGHPGDAEGDGFQPRVAELRTWLRTRLPDYMVPAAFVFLDALPLTPNGKVDRRALPAPGNARPSLASEFTAPRTPLERDIADAFMAVLGVESVGIHDSFFDLGGHSLLSVQLVAMLRDRLRCEFPLRLLFTDPTVAGLARVLENGAQGANTAADAHAGRIDLEAEATLDTTIVPNQRSVARATGTTGFLLTGVTGFLGAFLLDELLKQTKATIYCLVRAVDTGDGRRRIETALRAFRLWSDEAGSRIVPVVGDLARPRLGLSDAQFAALADAVGAIYHSGALVNFIYPYSAVKATNVLGTQEVLRLASQGHAKTVHHLSTVDILAAQQRDDHLIPEAPLPPPRDGRLGYVQSKWVAERLVMAAAARGLPVAIYRPWLITGHTVTGATHTSDYLCVALKANIQLGVAPQQDQTVNVMPVDYVSRAIVHLATQASSPGKLYQFANPQPVHLSDIYAWVQSFGYPLDVIPYPAWRARATSAGHSHALLPEFPLFELEEGGYPDFTIDCGNTLDGLRGSDIACPPIQERLLHTYLSYLVDTGFLPPPPGRDALLQDATKRRETSGRRI